MKKNSFPKKTFWILTSISIFSLSLVYVLQVNAYTRELYLNQNYEKSLEVLARESETLKIDFSKAGSLVNIESYLQNQNFEKVKQVKYIQIYSPVAQKPSSR